MKSRSTKRPSTPRDKPFARDKRGAATREDIRSTTKLVSPRRSLRPPERSRQRRTHS